MATLTDKRVETLIGQVLRAGMLISVAVTFLGMTVYLWHSGSGKPDYRVFNTARHSLFDVSELLPKVFHGNPIALIELGVLLLVATPVARVAFLVGAFAVERDRMYVAVSSLVLAILLYSLVFFR